MERVTIIAEAGVNHNGDLNLAVELIEKASQAGADYVKFQSFQADKLASRTAKKAAYQKANSPEGDNQYEMLKKLELSVADHKLLMESCRRNGIEFLSTPFDEESAQMLVDLGLPLLKIPSGELTNQPYLRFLGQLGPPLILSTGMASLEEVKAALETLENSGLSSLKITLLHCTTQYPTPYEEANLRAITTLKEKLAVKVGFSDHTSGIYAPLAAVALGACVIEKHFTLSRELPGPDHKASLEPEELAEMVRGVRAIEKALGDGVKRAQPSELANIPIARKSIHLAREVPENHVLTAEDLIMKRPGDGLSPGLVASLIGRQTARALGADHQLELADLV